MLYFYNSNSKSSEDVDATSTEALLDLIQTGKCVMHKEFNVVHPLHVPHIML